MKVLVFVLILLGLGVPSEALGRLVQPDGSILALGETEAEGTRTLLFGAGAVGATSWLTLPEGAILYDVELVTRNDRRRLSFPVVRIPGLRFAFEVPAHVLTVSLRGRLPADLTVQRSLSPPPRVGWVVRSQTELRVDLPRWKIAPGTTGYLRLTRPTEAPWQALLTDGTHSRVFSFLASVREWNYAPDAWGLAPTSLVVRGKDPRLDEVSAAAVGPAANLPADVPTLLAWPPSAWRTPSHEWFRWSGTSVLVLVTADYRWQDRYLKRLAFFVEKEGYRGRLVTDAEVAHLHAWNAHDYAAADLARFFNTAATEGFELNGAERELEGRLAASGILLRANGAWKAGTGALLGISAESPPALRSVLFVHEAFHGLYFTSAEFRAGVKRAWEGLSEASRQALRVYLSRSRYDPSDEGLMVNEFQAYVLQRPAVEWEGFFRDRVLEGAAPTVRVSALVEYLTAARALDALVKGLFGFPSGDVSAVRPVSES